jgi:hypothetical protein
MSFAENSARLSVDGKRRLLSRRGEPLFFAEWNRTVFLHYEADAVLLQKATPFQLDLRDGRAFVSMVAFTMRDLRFRIGGRLGAWLLKPIATHQFLNARTYVRHRGEPGIYFLGEWLSNPLSVRLGPGTFGLPYRFGKLAYEHAHETGELRGSVTAKAGSFSYRATLATSATFHPSKAGSLTEFLQERYTAFTRHGHARRFFRVWHEPWQQVSVEAKIIDDDLLATTGAWWESARLIGANYSPGVNVWMGWPHRIRDPFYENKNDRHPRMEQLDDRITI